MIGKAGVATAAVAAAFLLGCGGGSDGEKTAKGDAKAAYDLAFRKYQKGYYNEAVAMYKRALEVDPNLSKAHFDLGLIYDDYLPDKAKAIYHYSMYLKLEPDAGKASMVREWIEKARGESDLALAGPTPTAEVLRDDEAEYAGTPESERIKSLEMEIKAYLATIDELRKEVKRLTALQEGELAEEGGPSRKEKTSLERKYEKEKVELLKKFEQEKDAMKAAQDRANARIRVLEARLKTYESKKKETGARRVSTSSTARSSSPKKTSTSSSSPPRRRPAPTPARKSVSTTGRRGVTIPAL